jgi:hypothetical protein
MAPSYVRVEQKPGGHPWHLDTGTKNHMSWCKYTARVLLTPEDSFEGGGFYFRDDPNNALFGYRDLILFDQIPPNEHFVASHSGDRRVLLMFFA